MALCISPIHSPQVTDPAHASQRVTLSGGTSEEVCGDCRNLASELRSRGDLPVPADCNLLPKEPLRCPTVTRRPGFLTCFLETRRGPGASELAQKGPRTGASEGLRPQQARGIAGHRAPTWPRPVESKSHVRRILLAGLRPAQACRRPQEARSGPACRIPQGEASEGPTGPEGASQAPQRREAPRSVDRGASR